MSGEKKKYYEGSSPVPVGYTESIILAKIRKLP
jgi:hypothetical protein